MFLNAIMLLGVGTAVVPWVLHLLSRARYRNVDWGAMMFINDIDGSPRQSRKLSQRLLMVLRMAIIAVLAFAMARPTVIGSLPAPSKDQAITGIILLDCSPGMSAEENGHTRMTIARDAARQALGVHRGDRVSLILMGRKQSASDRQPSADLWDVARRIESAEPAASAGDIAASLDDALSDIRERELAGTGARQFVDFYIITDSLASAWRNVTPAFAHGFRARLEHANLSCRIFAIPIANGNADDVAIESVEQLSTPVVVNQPAEFEVKVRNFGPVQWAGLPLSVWFSGPDRINRFKLGDAVVNIGPESEASFRMTGLFRSAGTQIVSANLKIGTGRSESRFDKAIEVAEPTRVLIIAGDTVPAETIKRERDNPRDDSSAACLQAALAPFKTARQAGADAAAVEVVPAESWNGATVAIPRGARAQNHANRENETKLSVFQVVILADVESLTSPQAVALEQFVYDGGGVLIAPGTLSQPATYNELLFRNGKGILPAALDAPTAADGSEQTTISSLSLEHPIFRFVAGRPELYLTASVARHFHTGTTSPGAETIAYYSSGDPFLIEGTSGKGKVLLLTTSPANDWTSLPRTGTFYLPFMQSAARYLAFTSNTNLNIAPGDAIEVPLTPGHDDYDSSDVRSVIVTTPAGEQKPAELLRPDARTTARFTDTDEPGVYIVRVNDVSRPNTLAFVVRPPAAELDPSLLDQARWDHLANDLGVEKIDLGEHPLDSLVSPDSARHELWRPLLCGVALLVLLELMMSWRGCAENSRKAEQMSRREKLT